MGFLGGGQQPQQHQYYWWQLLFTTGRHAETSDLTTRAAIPHPGLTQLVKTVSGHYYHSSTSISLTNQVLYSGFQEQKVLLQLAVHQAFPSSFTSNYSVSFMDLQELLQHTVQQQRLSVDDGVYEHGTQLQMPLKIDQRSHPYLNRSQVHIGSGWVPTSPGHGSEHNLDQT